LETCRTSQLTRLPPKLPMSFSWARTTLHWKIATGPKSAGSDSKSARMRCGEMSKFRILKAEHLGKRSPKRVSWLQRHLYSKHRRWQGKRLQSGLARSAELLCSRSGRRQRRARTRRGRYPADPHREVEARDASKRCGEEEARDAVGRNATEAGVEVKACILKSIAA